MHPNYILVQSYPQRASPSISIPEIWTFPKNYNTTDKELLSIVEDVKEFRNILLGHKVTVYNDLKNLTYKILNTERVMCWRLIIEEFGPEIKYTKGEINVVADALSCLDMSDNNDILNIY